MTNEVEAAEILILRDEQGRYYLLPRPALEQARADEAQQAELAAALDDQDTAGFTTLGMSTLTPVAQFMAAPAPGGAGKVALHDFSFVKKIDKASPVL